MATAILRQSGGSVILAIPKAIAESMGVTAGSEVRLALHGRTLTATPGYSIEALVAGCTPENVHELQFDGEVGAERFE
jgi:antitoxin ChpS